MILGSNQLLTRLVILIVLVLAYFVIFPQDWLAVLSVLERLFAVSYSISPWLYGLLAVGLVCWTLVKIWGSRTPGA